MPSGDEGAFDETYQQYVCGDVFYYESEDGTVTITGCKPKVSKVVIPSEINGKPVTSIPGFTFNYKSDLTEVTIPNSVKEIGYFAFFGCSNLEKVNIP